MKETEKFELALLSSDLDTVKEMLSLDPTLIDETDGWGVKLSLRAADQCGLPMLRYLVEYGLRVNLNDTDAQGRDMLHYAALSGSVEKCRYLVEYGGMDPLRGDRKLQTPFDLAHRRGHRALEDYFAEYIGAPWSQTYHNPVRSGFYPDPSAIRVGNAYYMVNSSFTYFPCLPISRSEDLVHWRTVSHAIEKPEWAHLEGLEGGRGWWAPDISFSNGRFYICATLRLNDEGAVRRRQMVVTAEKPEGPYSEPVFIDEDGIDPSLFHDEDGRHYMLLNRGARIFELDKTCTRKISEPRLLHYGNHGRAPEGAHLLRHEGWYYLFQAEGGTGMGHRETVSRSKTLYGPYEPSPYNPVIRQWDERALLQRCGHAKPISTPDGRWYFLYLCGRLLEGQWTVLGRETALDPFIWTADGWPLLNAGRGPSVQNICPVASVVASVPENKTAVWVTPRPPKEGQIVWRGNCVTLHGDDCPMWDTACRSILLQRQTSFAFTFSATLTVPSSGEAGIVCYYDERSFLSLGVCAEMLVMSQQMGSRHMRSDCWSVELNPGSEITLRFRVNGLRREMWMIRNGEEKRLTTLDDVTYLADEGLREGKRFTGAMVGVYALGTSMTFSAMTKEDGA